MKKILITLLCLTGSFSIASAAGHKKSAEPAATPVSTPAPVVATDDNVALVTVKMKKEYQLLPVIIEFYDADAPVTVANFKKLVHKKFYNGVTFHRVFPHTLVQAGDPLSKRSDRSHVGTGGPGYTLPPEIRRKHTLGAVAMSRLSDKINPSRVSSGSQFYICLQPQPNLDGQYTVFGHVVRGMENLNKISMLAKDSNDNPIERAEILSVKILPRGEAEKLAEREEKQNRQNSCNFSSL